MLYEQFEEEYKTRIAIAGQLKPSKIYILANWEHFRISGFLLALTRQAIPAPEPRLGPSGLLVENEFEVSFFVLVSNLNFLT